MSKDTRGPTKQDVINWMRPMFQRAVRDRTGVSYLMSEAEAKVFSDDDLQALEAEVGYPAPALPIWTHWPKSASSQEPGTKTCI
jgi:hypothetical protein